MYKISNWLFGSFFRTLGRILVYIFIGYILFNIIDIDSIKLPKLDISSILFTDVSADVLKIPDDEESYVYIDDNLYSEYYNLSSTTANNDINFRLSLTTLNSVASIYPFLIVDICSTASLYSYRTSSLGQSCSNSCFQNQVNVENTSYICSANGYQGNIYRIKVPISKWGDGVDTDTKNVNDRLSIGTNVLYNVANTIYGIYLTNSLEETPNTIDYTSTINNVNNNISSNATDIINNQNANKNAIINNQNSNSQAEINNATQNKNDIINNQNANSQAEINSQKVCEVYDINAIKNDNSRLNPQGNIISDNGFGVTDYITINSNSDLSLLYNTSTYQTSTRLCFYNINKSFISCINQSEITENQKVTIPSNASFLRFTIYKTENRPQYQICKNGNQAIGDSLNDMNRNLTNDNINDQGTNDFVNGLNHEYSSLTPFSDFINLPLTWIQSLLSSNQNCQPIELPLPFVNKNLTLPCMTEFWNSMGLLKTLIELVWIAVVGVRIFNGLFLLTCDTLDPNPDKDMTRLRTWEL